MIIRPEPLTSVAFRAFGDVLETDGRRAELINAGNTLKFSDLASLEFGEAGAACVSIYRSTAMATPFQVRKLERHPLGSQAFIPLHTRPFPVIVALPGNAPAAGSVRAFLSNGRQGINLRPGVWHHYQLSLDRDSEYLVIDRAGPGDNFEECILDGELVLQL